MASTRTVTSVRRAFEEARPADISSNTLENVRDWAIHNDPSLLVDIEDELAFRAS